MAFTHLNDHIDELGNHIEAYINSMVEYYKLSFFKKFMKGLSTLTKLLIVGSIFLFFLGFISIGFAIWIGICTGSIACGFFIVGGFYLLVFILLLIFWKKLVEGIFLEKFSRFIFNDNESALETDLEKIKDEVEENKIRDENAWRSDYEL